MSQLLARRLQRTGKLSLNMDEKTGRTSPESDLYIFFVRVRRGGEQWHRAEHTHKAPLGLVVSGADASSRKIDAMALVVTNTAAMRAQNAMRFAEAASQRSMERITTGKRINSGKDDPAGLGIATRLAVQITDMKQQVRVAQDEISRVQTGDGILSEKTQVMHRLRELTLQAASGTYSDADRAAANDEFDALVDHIRRTIGQSAYNGKRLFDDSPGASRGAARSEEPMKLDTSPPTGLSLSTQAGASAALTSLDAVMDKIVFGRSSYGVSMNRLEHLSNNMENGIINLTDAYGRIMDTDYAAETAALAKSQILLQASTAMLSQANKMTGDLIRRLLE